jgi:hypothetical protein
MLYLLREQRLNGVLCIFSNQGDRFENADKTILRAFLMQLAIAMFLSIPIAFACTRTNSSSVAATGVVADTSNSLLNSLVLNTATAKNNYTPYSASGYIAPSTYRKGHNDDDDDDDRPRLPIPTGIPKPGQPDRPAPGPVPVPPSDNCDTCLTNGVTLSTVILSWIFTALSALWVLMEMAAWSAAGTAVTGVIMGLCSFPLIVAMFAVGLNRWYDYTRRSC